MKRKIIISEIQYKRLKRQLNEDEYHGVMVKEISTDLSSNYDRALETYRDGNEFKKRKIFQSKIDGEAITPHNLLEYLKQKYDVSEDFLKQVMNDWVEDKIKDNMLSKNVTAR